MGVRYWMPLMFAMITFCLISLQCIPVAGLLPQQLSCHNLQDVLHKSGMKLAMLWASTLKWQTWNKLNRILKENVSYAWKHGLNVAMTAAGRSCFVYYTICSCFLLPRTFMITCVKLLPRTIPFDYIRTICKVSTLAVYMQYTVCIYSLHNALLA